MKHYLLIMAVCLCATSIAHADERKELAKKEVAAGIAAQQAGKFDEAIAHYNKAYQAVPHPEILFDLGQAYRLKGEPEAAIDAYERYLSVEPSGRAAPEANRLVAELKKQIEARKVGPPNANDARAAEEARRAEELRRADDARKAEDARSAEDARRAEQTRPTVVGSSQTDDRRSDLRTYAMYAVAGGGTLMALSLLYGGLAHQKLTQARAICPDGACANGMDTDAANSLLRESRKRGNIATVLVILGVGGLGTGGYLWWRHSQRPRASAVRATPVITPDHVGVSLGGSF